VKPLFEYYVALLCKSNDSIVKEWTGKELRVFLSCASINGKLYVTVYTEVDIVFSTIYIFGIDLNILA